MRRLVCGLALALLAGSLFAAVSADAAPRGGWSGGYGRSAMQPRKVVVNRTTIVQSVTHAAPTSAGSGLLGTFLGSTAGAVVGNVIADQMRDDKPAEQPAAIQPPPAAGDAVVKQ